MSAMAKFAMILPVVFAALGSLQVVAARRSGKTDKEETGAVLGELVGAVKDGREGGLEKGGWKAVDWLTDKSKQKFTEFFHLLADQDGGKNMSATKLRELNGLIIKSQGLKVNDMEIESLTEGEGIEADGKVTVDVFLSVMAKTILKGLFNALGANKAHAEGMCQESLVVRYSTAAGEKGLLRLQSDWVRVPVAEKLVSGGTCTEGQCRICRKHYEARCTSSSLRVTTDCKDGPDGTWGQVRMEERGFSFLSVRTKRSVSLQDGESDLKLLVSPGASDLKWVTMDVISADTGEEAPLGEMVLTDGYLTLEEYAKWQKLAKLSSLEVEASFNEKDKDHDGKINFQEFCELAIAVRQGGYTR